MRWLFALAIVLACSLDVRAATPPSMAGWNRVPDLQFQFERDHAACTKGLAPVPSRQVKQLGLPMPSATDFNECMRGLGWEKK
jgi:hypothetical protein